MAVDEMAEEAVEEAVVATAGVASVAGAARARGAATAGLVDVAHLRTSRCHAVGPGRARPTRGRGRVRDRAPTKARIWPATFLVIFSYKEVLFMEGSHFHLIVL